MGFFGKLAFWKKGDAGLGAHGADPYGLGPVGQQQGFGDPNAGMNDPFMQGMGGNSTMGDPYAAQMGMGHQGDDRQTPFVGGPGSVPLGAQVGGGGIVGQEYQSPQSQGYGQPLPAGNIDKDLQIISLKLDTIKSELDNMKQRLEKIERIAEGEAVKGKKIDYGW